MRDFLTKQLTYLTINHDGDAQAVADDCGYIISDIEAMAIEYGLPSLVASAQACRPTRPAIRVLIAEGLQAVPEKPIERDWLLPSEVALQLRVSQNKVHVWIREGRIAATNVNTDGRPSWRIHKDNVSGVSPKPLPPRRKRGK